MAISFQDTMHLTWLPSSCLLHIPIWSRILSLILELIWITPNTTINSAWVWTSYETQSYAVRVTLPSVPIEVSTLDVLFSCYEACIVAVDGIPCVRWQTMYDIIACDDAISISSWYFSIIDSAVRHTMQVLYSFAGLRYSILRMRVSPTLLTRGTLCYYIILLLSNHLSLFSVCKPEYTYYTRPESYNVISHSGRVMRRNYDWTAFYLSSLLGGQD